VRERLQRENIKRIEDEAKALDKLKDANEKLNKDLAIIYTKDLTNYDLAQKDKLKTNDEYYENQKSSVEQVQKAEDNYNKWLVDQRQAAVDDSLRAIAGSLTSFGDLFETQKQRELSAVGDNAAKREEIEKKYAKKQQLLAEGQALINGAMAITEIWRKWSYNPVLAGVFTALASAQTIAQLAVIRSQKFAKGGSGVLDGAVHASGGISIPGIGEAEGGEHFSIISRSATSKYGGRMLDAVANSINQGKFFEVWSNANKGMGNGDPYTKKMYDLMVKTPTVYTDSLGNTVKEYPNGKKFVIKRLFLN